MQISCQSLRIKGKSNKIIASRWESAKTESHHGHGAVGGLEQAGKEHSLSQQEGGCCQMPIHLP
jgi:hypothetical protein